tara:strand:+ start:1599 stop:2402 length:804 start_codon:yes stop_codon:yes gene_type:complete
MLFGLDQSKNDFLIGVVIENKSSNPIAYAHIGVPNLKIGTVADESGRFKLKISKMDIQDTLYVSSVGYSTVKISYEEIRGKGELNILLDKKVSALQEISVTAMKEEKISLGRLRAYNLSGWSFSGLAKGNEVGRMFSNSKKIELVDLSFHIRSSDFDSLIYRIHFYEYRSEKLDLINNNEIYLKSNTTKGWVNVDLESQKLIIEGDFLVSLELVEGWIDNKKNRIGAIVYSAKDSRKKETLVRMHQFMEFEKVDLVLSMRVNAYVLR